MQPQATDLASIAQKLYTPIGPFQTRLIALHGDHGADLPLECHLYTAYLSHPKFDGLPTCIPGETEILIPYEALSYTWGKGELERTVSCNGIDFPISETLFQALRALRRSRDHDRYLWIDALCINQTDKKEKSEQVWNMLQIYQQATKVIAWLDSTVHDDLKQLVTAAGAISSNISPETVFDVDALCSALSYLYKRPWFKRIWIQQEIYAARRLVMQCGDFRFQWLPLLSNPRQLLELPQLKSYAELVLPKPTPQPWEVGKGYSYGPIDKMFLHRDQWKLGRHMKELKATLPDDISAQLDIISGLHRLHMDLACFDRFSKNDNQFDIIETLLRTGILEATNARDYIYGIVGMVGVPTEPMPIQKWLKARQKKFFIPIDYLADIPSVLAVMTWFLLMKGGIILLAKFKVFPEGKDDLPSWVIDWPLAARLFIQMEYLDHPDYYLPDNLNTAWSSLRIEGTEPLPGRRSPPDPEIPDLRYQQDNSPPPGRRLLPNPPPDAHLQFQRDNMSSGLFYKKLILRGIVDDGFYAKDRFVWQKRRAKDKEIWKLEFEVYPTDLVVYMLAFIGPRYQGSPSIADMIEEGGIRARQYWSGGPWLLRPAGDEFKLMACLSWLPSERLPLYTSWRLNPDKKQPCCRLVKDPIKVPQTALTRPVYYFKPGENDNAEIQRFTII